MTGKKLADLATASVAVIVSLVLAEAAFRIAFGVPVFHLENFRLTQTIRDTMSNSSEYDPVLGWRMKPHLRIVSKVGATFTTIDYGIRKNSKNGDRFVLAVFWSPAPLSPRVPRLVMKGRSRRNSKPSSACLL